MAVKLILGGVDSACHPSEVGKISASLLVSCVGVVTCPGLYPIAKETALAAQTLCTEYGPNGWMDEIITEKQDRSSVEILVLMSFNEAGKNEC